MKDDIYNLILKFASLKEKGGGNIFRIVKGRIRVADICGAGFF